MIGQTISHYKILDKIGEGGMGVVYKAEDTKLHRIVALKFIRPDAVENPELKARFLNEAEAAAALIHPNIAVVHEIDEVDGDSFIAMEFVDGESLAAKIKKRPLPVREALDIASQIVEGLRAAHDKGIDHRDIKPANVMIDSAGRAKVMDFGLAHLEEATRITKTGSSIGTPAYMSPEQVSGEKVDHRSDIWSVGVVLYEMVTGQLPFRGDLTEAISHAVLYESPEPLTALRSGLPIELDWLVAKLLAKSPEERYQHVEELAVDLRGLERKMEAGETVIRTTPPPESTPRPAPLQQRSSRWLWPLVVGLMLSCAAAIGLWVTRPEPSPAGPFRRFALDSGRNAVISPNGRFVAYTTDGKLMVRDLQRQEAEVIAEVPRHGPRLAWSPESDFIAYSNGSQLRRVSRTGGTPSRICNRLASSIQGVSWSPDGESIVYGSFSGGPQRLYIVTAEGGVPRLLFDRSPTEGLQNEVDPHFVIPSNRPVLLYTKQEGQERWIQAYDLETGSETTVCQGSRPAYSPTGHVIYENTGRLWAVAFSNQKLAPTGEPFELTEGGQHPSVSADGTLVYWEGGEQVAQKLEQWDRSGSLLRTIGQPQERIMFPVVSPDGRRVAVRAGGDIWIHHVDRPLRTRLISDPASDILAAWSPSGREIAFSSDRSGSFDIYIMPTDGSQGARAVTDGPLSEFVWDWSVDGRYIVYYTYAPSEEQTGADIMYLEKTPDGHYKPNSFLQTAFDEMSPSLSPDGRFIAYQSDETGRNEVFVREFPGGAGKVQVSTSGGYQPQWSRDSGELFYFGRGGVIAVEYRADPEFRVEGEEFLFQLPIDNHRLYAVAPDGRSFFVGQAEGESQEPGIRVVQNWFAEFEGQQ